MNEQTETMAPAIEQPAQANGVRPATPTPVHTSAAIAPSAGCPTCGGVGAAGVSPNVTGLPSFVYAIGRIEARFPNLAAEKEFAQATGRADTAGKTDQAAFHAVLS